MSCVRIVAFAVTALGLGLIPGPGLAQSVDIPLSYAINNGYNYGFNNANPALVLTINVGINGGAAQTYAFDTGSSVFLTPNSLFAGSGATVLATGVEVEKYGSSTSASTFTGDIYQISASSLKFYATAGATSGGISLGTSGNYNVTSYTSYSVTGGGATSSQPFGLSVGVFGASALAFTKNVGGTDIGLGSVIGQTNVAANTTAGYVVSANGQSLAALNQQLNTGIPGGAVTGAQQAIQTVSPSITSCNPCVTVGLTPALIAQFQSVNTVDAGTNGISFPNSNVLSMGKFVPLNITIGVGTTFSSNVSLDTGWTDFSVGHAANGSTLTISASHIGTQEVFNIASHAGVPAPYSAPSNDNILGVGFFVQNSVLYNLAGQQVGFSSNFVTDANIATTQPLVIDANSVPLGLAGVISGPGGLSITAGGSATLSGTNTYTGPTTVSGNSAYLALVGPGSIAASSGVNVSAGGWFDVSGASTTATIKSLSGDVVGLVWLGANSLALSAANGAFAGTIVGTGGVELMSGHQTLSGINGYTGMTMVSGGTLTVNGTIASSFLTVVGSGATLTGTGEVGLLSVLDGGTFAPAWGMSGRTMSVAGDLILSSGANYAVQLGASSLPFANVSGNATLAGTLAVSAAPGSALVRQYDLLHSGSLGGTNFNALATSLPGFSTSLTYSATDAYLTLNSALASQTSGLGANAQRIAKLLDTSFNTTGTLPAGLSPLYTLTGRNLGNALTQASGEAATSAQQTSFNAMDQFLGLLMDPGVGEQGGTRWSTTGVSNFSSANDEELAYAAKARVRSASERDAYGLMAKAPLRTNYDPRWSVWASGFGGSQSSDGNAAVGSNAATSQIFGTAVGADYLLSPRTIMGFALAGGGTSASVAGSGSMRSDLFQAGAFVRHKAGAAYVTAGIGYGWQDITTDRMVTTSGDRLRAEFRADTWSGRLEGGYRVAVPSIKDLGITPYAAAQFTTVSLPAYAESAVAGTGAFALSYAGRNVTDSRSEIGVRTDQTFALRNGLLTVNGRLAWAHDFDPERWAAASFLALPASGFTVNGAAQGRDAVLTSLGVDYIWLNGWSARAGFEGAFSDVSRSYAGKGLLRYTW